MVCNVGCDSDDDPGIDITGTWIGERSYYNPAAGIKYQYIYLTFNSNGTVDLEYQGPASSAYGTLYYNVSGNKVICRGVYVSTYDDEPTTDYMLTLEIRGNTLVPLNHFTNFVLTRNGEGLDDGDDNDESGEGDDVAKADIIKKIQQAMNPTVSYSEYEFNVVLNSNVEREFRDKSVKYFLKGYLDDYSTNTSKQIYGSEKQRIWGGFDGVYQFQYTSIADYELCSDYVVRLDMFFASYNALKSKDIDLTQEEKQLYRELKAYLDEASPYDFHGEICVEIDSVLYNVFSYLYKPYDNSVTVSKIQ